MIYYWEKENLDGFIRTRQYIFLYLVRNNRGHYTKKFIIGDIRISMNLLIQGFKI